MPLHYILWTFDGVLPYPVFVTSRVLGCLSTENTHKWIDSALRFNNSKSFLLLTSLIILQVSPSLIGYIIIVLKFLPVLSGPSSRSTISDNELSLHWYSSPYHFSPWTASLILTLCRTRGFNNLSLHHSFDLMSSPIDYTFMKSLGKCVVIIINLMSSSRISIGFMMRNTILASMICVIIDNILDFPLDTNLFVYCVIPWVPCYPALFFLTLEYYHLLCQECRGNFTTS